MFESQIPSPERFSPRRLAVSALLHGLALFLALSLRFAAPPAPAAARQTTVILAPLKRISAPKFVPRTFAPVPQSPRIEHRAFLAPHLEAPRATASPSVEVTLLDHEPPPAVPVQPRIAASLPPPPVIVGKLSAVTTAPSPAATDRVLRTTSLSATPEPSQPSPLRTPRASGFGDSTITADPTRKTTVAASEIKAVEILSKPRPLYTDEARRLRIEGEVLLEILFAASGTPHVERILRGLGHGLDESAAASAAQIQFRPAIRAGQPVDQIATVHITFQLAY